MFNYFLTSSTDAPSSGDEPESVQNFFANLIETIVNFFKNHGVDLAIRLVSAIIIIVIGHYLVKFINKIVISSIRSKKKRSNGIDEVSVVAFISSCLKFGLNLLLFFLVLGVLNIPLDNVFTILSSAILAIGLALQDLLANFANGVVLLANKFFKSGDYIETDGTEGTVQEINMLTTVLQSADGKKIVVPNSSITKSVIVNNSSNETRRVTINIGVAYGTNVEAARKALLLAAYSCNKSLTDPEPAVRFSSYGDSAINLSLRVWVKTDDYWDALFEINEAVYNYLNKYNIEIAFPQVDVHVNNVSGKKTITSETNSDLNNELDKTKEALILAKINEKQKQEEQDKDMFSSAFKKSKEKARKSRKNKSEKKNAKEDKWFLF